MLTNRSIPRCTVIPELDYPDIGQAVDWLCSAFGFNLRLRIGDHRAQLNVGDGAIVLTTRGTERRSKSGEGEQSSPHRVESAHAVLVRVEDVDRHYEQARKLGARILQTPTDHPYGERQYSVEDFAGHRWTFSQSIADVDPRDWGGTPGAL